ncbi:MAG: asparagine synthase (glutamine-hydrolyzing) [Deltaproteobacteria bacterium]|nr:asparagine synthase (glutamine-hydrolyzing) [Deltaproteobacteria bacterium]
MCGIAGVVERPGVAVDGALPAAQARSLSHRGPDGRGTWRGDGTLGHVELAHARLSVLDVAGGAQPMVDDDRQPRVALVFNGQIYNHAALRPTLVAAGERFRSSHSDTEVLLRLLADAWDRGTDDADVCARLSGMFAFAAVDVRRRRLVLARDPAGKKPLYIAGPRFFDRPRLAFGSELSALEALDGRRGDVDLGAVARYFAFDFVPDPDCVWAGAAKLPPGHVVAVDLDDPATWDDVVARARPFRLPRFATVALPETFGERTALVRGTVEAAVATRLVADVPVGVFLSGGVDSSLVAALAARHTSRLQTFSIGFTEPSFDESGWARAVARHIGSTHHEEIVDDGAVLDAIPWLGDQLAEPFADHSVVPTWLLARFARRQVTVALGGDGGDELFLGYGTFLVDDLRRRARLPEGAWRAAARLLGPWAARLPVSHADLSVEYKLQRALDGVGEGRPLRRHQRFLTGADDARLRSLFSPAARAALPAGDLLGGLDVLERGALDCGARDDVDLAVWGYLRTYLAAGVLQKVDRATMLTGLEARAPLLDDVVVALALSLPTADKIAGPPWGRSGKHILKEAARGLVPDAVLARGKKGFGMPVASWLNGALAPLVDELLSPRAVRLDGVLDPLVVGRLVDEHRRRRANHRKMLWTMLMWMLWRRRGRRLASSSA